MGKLINSSSASYNEINPLTGRCIREDIKKRNGKVNINFLNNINSDNKIVNGYISLINKIKNNNNKNQFKNFLDYLTVALRSRYSGVDINKDKIKFSDTGGIGKFSITREGIKEYLDFIFNKELEINDDEIDAILEMCTHRHTSFSSVASYTNTSKEFLSKIGIENINNENLLKIKDLLEKPLCKKNTFDYFIMMSIIKGNLNYSNKKTLFNSFNESIKNLTDNDSSILFNNCLLQSDKIYQRKLNEVVNKFKVPEEEKKSDAYKLIDYALEAQSPYMLNDIFKAWSSFKFDSPLFSNNEILITEDLLEKIFTKLTLTDNKNLISQIDHKKIFFTEGLKIALKLADANAYNILLTKSLEYYQTTKNNLVLDNILAVIKSNNNFGSLENKNEILKLIVDNKSELGIELIAIYFKLNNKNKNLCINSLFLENLKLINESENKNLLKSLCDLYKEFKAVINDNVKNELILKVFTYVKPEDEIISNELITEFFSDVNNNYLSFLLLRNKNTLTDWINFSTDKKEYNNFINLCLNLNIIDDKLLENILKKYNLISNEHKKELLDCIQPDSIDKQEYLKIFLNSLNINNEDKVFLNKLISKCLINIKDCTSDFMDLLCDKCYQFKYFIYNHNLNSLISNLLQYTDSDNQQIFSNHRDNFIEYVKTNQPRWKDIFNNDKYIFNYIDTCYQNNIFDVSALEILIPMLAKKYSHQEIPNYTKKLNYLIYMANKNNLTSANSLINENIYAILNPYEEPKLKIFVALLFENIKKHKFLNNPIKFLIDSDNISTLFFNNKKNKIVNVDKYFKHINSITNLESLINPEKDKELFDKLLFIKNMNTNLKKSLLTYYKKKSPEYTQKRLQQIFEFFIQALFNKKLTTRSLIQLLKNSDQTLFYEDENKDFIEAFAALRVHNNTGRTSFLNPEETGTWKMLKNAVISNENLSLSRKMSNGSDNTTDSLSEKNSIGSIELN
ncbi:MAG TPA: hypothetical protein PKD00_04440 [Burkholderiales bacterium]|nr:hypothetical protein [Burkholderiales bacterium]